MVKSISKAVVAFSLLSGSIHAQTANPVTEESGKTLKVAILVVDAVELLDASGPAEVFVAATFQGDTNYEVFTVAPEKGSIGIMGFGRLEPDYGFEDCPGPDIVVIPGGGIVPRLEDESIIGWIQEQGRTGCVMFSVCTGALALAKAGLLDGLEATTHRKALDVLRKAAPEATVLEGRRYVDNGKVITSAGVSSGIDAALHLVERFSGEEAAAKTVRYLEWNRSRPGSDGE